MDDVAPAPHLARGLGAERLGDRRREHAGAVQEQAAPLRPPLAGERREDLPFRLGPDAGRLAQPPLLRSGAQLVRRADSEGAADRDHPLRSEAEEPPERDELRLDLPLELL